MTAQRPAAFFDFDGTLIRGDSQAKEVIWRLHHEPRRAEFALRLIPTLITALLTELDLVSQRVHNQAYISTYRGRKVDDLMKQGEDLFREEIRCAFIPQTLEIMAAHRRAGHAIVIASATPLHILAPAERYLRPDFLISTRLETDTLGSCTGRALGAICIGAEKANRIRNLAACQRLDLTAAHAYTDHHVDLPMLTSVGYPHVINPSRPLEDTAGKRGWPIHHFRR